MTLTPSNKFKHVLPDGFRAYPLSVWPTSTGFTIPVLVVNADATRSIRVEHQTTLKDNDVEQGVAEAVRIAGVRLQNGEGAPLPEETRAMVGTVHGS